MKRFKRILCPLDLTTASAEELRYAVSLARTYGARLFLYHQIRQTQLFKNPEQEQHARDVINEMLEEALLKPSGHDQSSKLCRKQIIIKNSSNLVEGILKVAMDCEANLIVMRSRRRPHAAALFGSTAEEICHISSCPVLVTHKDEREFAGRTTSEMDLRRILVAYDFSVKSEIALNYGLSLAQEYQAELHLFHVLPYPSDKEPEVAWSTGGAKVVYKNTLYLLSQAIPEESLNWCDVKPVVKWGKPCCETLSYAQENEIDLICMGVTSGNFSGWALFGSNVNRVLRKSPCPVLVAPSHLQNQNIQKDEVVSSSAAKLSGMETKRENSDCFKKGRDL